MTSIRAYATQDDDDIIAVWEAVSRLAHPFLSEDFIASERTAIRDIYLPNTITYVAEDDGRVVGFTSLIGDEVGAIFVLPELHGKGLGRALMDSASKGKDFLEVEVFEKNNIGRPFYESYGFEELKRSVHEATGERLIRMRWSLAESKKA